LARHGTSTSLVLLLLLATCLWTFWSSLWNPFHFDDALFLQSPQIAEPGDPWYLLKPAQSRQLTYLTFYWNYRIGSTSPFGYHLINLFLHLANVLALFACARLMLQRKPETFDPWMQRWLPLAAVGIFALHPVQTEAVNYVYQRSTLLAALFTLLSLNSFLHAQSSRKRKVWLIASVLFFLLAVVSKEAALALPLLWVALLLTESGDFRAFSRSLMRARWFALLCTLTFLAGVWILIHLRGGGERAAAPGFLRSSLRYLLAQIQVLPGYVRMLILPTGLSIDHDFRPAPALSPYGLLCALALAGIVGFALFVRKRNSSLSFLILAFLIFLAPTSSIIPSHDLFFEHRLYMPMIASAILLAWSVFALMARIPIANRQKTVASVAILCLLSGCYAALAKSRTFVWGDNVRLWEDAALKAPLKVRVHYNLGTSWLNRDRKRARQELLKAVELDPKYGAALYDLGWIAQVEGDRDSARKYYGMAIQVDPKLWQAHHNLGNLDLLQGRPEAAMREFEETIRLRGDYAPAYVNLATLQMRIGDAQSALQTLEGLMRFRWDLLDARVLRANAFLQEGRLAEADNELTFISEHDTGGAYRDRIGVLRGMLSARAKNSR
jgi:protein O-mannosyl-transferase